MNTEVVKRLVEMAHSPIYNYIVPGLESWLIMDNGDAGKIRMFHSTRTQQEFITPHNHRFDFSAHVVCGSVENTLWVPAREVDHLNGEMYACSDLRYMGSPGDYQKHTSIIQPYVCRSQRHDAGAWYSMKAEEIHSIKFARDTRVLFFEGPEIASVTKVLEPYVNNRVVPTMKTEEWMFEKGKTK